MSQANVEACHRMREAVNRGDVKGVLADLDEHIELIPRRAAVQGVFRGHGGVREYLADTAESFDLFRVHNEEMRDLGDRVLAFDTLTVRGRGSGVEVDLPTAIVMTFRDGKIVRFEDFGERAAALQAVGLSE